MRCARGSAVSRTRVIAWTWSRCQRWAMMTALLVSGLGSPRVENTVRHGELAPRDHTTFEEGG